MHEALVQWTLLNNRKSLSDYLDFNVATILGQEITTDFGRIDFVLEDHTNKQLVVELETTLNTKSKLDYCFKQVLNYNNTKKQEQDN
jgi:DNA-binding sugar fermentation-stimulating protein